MSILFKLLVVLGCFFPSVQTFGQTIPPLQVSAIQRAGFDQIVFSFNDPTSFRQQKTAEGYRLIFNKNVDLDALNLDQMIAILPDQLRKWTVTHSNNQTQIDITLPKGFLANATLKGKSILLNLSRDLANDPAIKTVKPKVTIEEIAKLPIPVVTKSIIKRLESPKIEAIPPIVSTQRKDTLSHLVPYKEHEQNISLLELSKPIGLATKEKKSELLKNTGRTVTLSFPWLRMTSAAAFRRDGYLWIVFDRKEQFKFETELQLHKDIILEMIQIPHSHATIYRLVTREGYNPSFRREGLLWIVDLMYQPIQPLQSIELVLQRKTPFGPRIFIPLEEAPQVIPLIDPEVGDLMYIVPVFSLGKGLPTQRSFVDATFLQTVQGVVIVPNIENLNVYGSTSGLEVRGPQGGMRFSSEDILSYLAKSRASKDPLSQILDVGLWQLNGDVLSYYKTLQELQNNVISAPKQEKALKRLTLARFYFANGMYPEALGVLRVLVADDPSFEKVPSFIALRGAVNFMMLRYAEAMKDLASALLDQDSAVMFWRAATLSAISGNPEKYLEIMKSNMGILQTYPAIIKTRLALAGLHAAVAQEDEFAIQNFLEAAYHPENTNAENSEVTYYHALWQEHTGQYSTAIKEMQVLEAGRDYYFRAMAGLERIRMQARLGLITPEKRIEDLEQLMYAWRGDEFEYNLMTMLAHAHQDQKKYDKVLYLLKDMRVRFKDMPESNKIPALMEEVFEKVYLGDEETSLPPIKAIALYEEFSDLKPKGPKGTQIVSRLADRLVAIDLLDPAAILLEKQLAEPIPSKEKGIIQTRLALVRLLNKEPEKALQALEKSTQEIFSDKVRTQRLYIKAKALADFGKVDQAGTLLEKETSPEANALRAEIYWQAKQWDKAADALKLLISRPTPNVPLTAQEAQRVLDWAVALRLAGRSKVVLRLRENFLPYMQQTSLAKPFDFITQTPDKGVMDFRNVADEVLSAESFQTFAKDYIDILKTQGLSQAVQ